MLKPRPVILNLMRLSGWWVMIASAILGGYALLSNLTLDGPRYQLSAFSLLFAAFLGGCAMLLLVRLFRRLN
jgi:hypothetical protein